MEASWRGFRIAVTGASGFCGSVVARAAAAAGADVVCLGRRPGPVGKHFTWDAAREAPDLAGADVVIHLAATVGGPSTWTQFRRVNVDGGRRLLDAARSRPVVWVSTASVYDPRLDRGLVREDHPVGGHLTAYTRTKAAGERFALAAGAVVLRPYAVYGPGDRYLLPRIVNAARCGRVLLPGADVRLSLTAVENLADACLTAPAWPAGAYNITDAAPYQRDDAIVATLRALGTNARIRHVPIWLAAAAADATAGRTRLGPYTVEQVASTVVLDGTRAAQQGFRPRRVLADYLRDLGSRPPEASRQVSRR